MPDEKEMVLHMYEEMKKINKDKCLRITDCFLQRKSNRRQGVVLVDNRSKFISHKVFQLVKTKKVPMKNSLVSWGTSDYSAAAREWREEENLGGRNIATISYTVNNTGDIFETSEHSEGSHSEKLLYDYFVTTYGNDYKNKITFHWLYTERETCGEDYHDCSSKVQSWFGLSGNQVFASVVYPDAGEMSGDEEEQREKAVRRRSRSTNIIKRFQTRASAVSSGKAAYNDPYSGGITAPMSPSYYPEDEQYYT